MATGKRMSLASIVFWLISCGSGCTDGVVDPDGGTAGQEIPRASGQLPERPRTHVDLTRPTLSGNVIRLEAGGDLQAALTAADAGDVIELPAGATFDGPFTLPPRSSNGYVIIRSSRAGHLEADERVTLADTVHMARLTGGASNQRVLVAPPGATGYWLEGIEILPLASGQLPAVLNALVEFQLGSERLVFDRVIVRGRKDTNMQRCIIMNGATAAVTNSWIGECHAKGFDSQAIVGWKGPGPFHIENNYLGGAGENVMFGGAQLGDDGQIPSDITIRRNHIHKPLEWQGIWTVKNLLELKFGRRVLIEQNVLENVWADAQVGFAINLKSENRDVERGRMDVATEDVTFLDNVVMNARFGVTIIPKASSAHQSGDGVTSRVLFQNNHIGATESIAFQVAGVPDLNLNQNTAKGRFNIERELTRFVMTGNLLFGEIKGSGVPVGAGALAERAPGGLVTGNVFISDISAEYPEGNIRLPIGSSYSGPAGANTSNLQSVSAKVRF